MSNGLIPRDHVPSVPKLLDFERLAHAVELALFRGRNEHSVRSIAKSLQLFGEFIGARGFGQISKALLGAGLGPANLMALEWRDSLAKAGKSPSTINNRLNALQVLAGLWRFAGVIAWEIDLHTVPVETYRDTSGPGTERFSKAMTDLDEKEGPRDARDRVILILLHDGGLRVGELASIDLEHFDPDGPCVWVKAKKRTSRVRIDLAPDMKRAIEAWIAIRGTSPGPLFTNFDRAKKGSRLTCRSIARITHARGVGRPHGIRHLAIGEVCEATNGNILESAKFARHRDPKVTMVYIDALKRRDAKASKILAKYRKGQKKGIQ